MSQAHYEQTVAPFEKFLAAGKEIAFLANIERTGSCPGDGIEIDSVMEVCVIGVVIFDESSPGFFVEDFQVGDESGEEVDVTDDEYRKFCFQLIEKYMKEAV